MKKISIIITSYKHENFIKYTIESILSQTYNNWELLIWDDSPDNKTWEIIQFYKKKYPKKIKTWHHKINKWLVENIIFLIEKVSFDSEYISFLDWDDMYSNNNLDEKINIFKKYPNVGIITTWIKFIDELNNEKKISLIWELENNQKKWIKKYNIKNMILSIHPPIRSFWNIIVKKEFLKYFKKINLWKYKSDNIFIPYDLSIWLKIFPKTFVYHISKKLLLYRFHNNNNSWLENHKKLLEQTLFVINKYKRNYSEEVLYVNDLIKSKIYLLDWKTFKSLKLLIKSFFLFPFNNLTYKISILIDILKIKKIIIKVLNFIWTKQ